MKSVTRAYGALPLLCLAAALSAPTQVAALTASQAFNVTVNLTPVCTLSTPAALVLDYTSGQSFVASTASTFTATCTEGVAYGLSLSSTTVSAAGLTATLEIQDNDAPNAAVTADVIAASAAPRSFRVFGSIPAGGAGVCTANDTVNGTVTCATVTASRTLTLTY
jgi:hypothetical protein